MNQTQWSVGNWCLFEHNICQIKEMKDGRVTSLGDGNFEMGSQDFSDRMFPLSLRGKNAADWFEDKYNELHRLFGCTIRNWPEISRRVNNMFNETMDAIVSNNDKAAEDSFYRAQKFFQAFHQKMQEVQHINIEGIEILSR